MNNNKVESKSLSAISGMNAIAGMGALAVLD